MPEETKITVFRNGSKNGSNGVIPSGGQTQPIQIEGDKETWKKVQKNEKKKQKFWKKK